MAKPADHPDFFRFPAPAGRSRESSIALDAQGRFWHDGQLVEHPGMQRAFSSWIGRHPDDGRYILTNGYDWTYFRVEDEPFFVRSVRLEPATQGHRIWLILSDGSQERLTDQRLWIGSDNALKVSIKNSKFNAKFTPSAQRALEPVLGEKDGHIGLGTDVGWRPIGKSAELPSGE